MNWIKKGLIYNVDGSVSWARSHAQVPVVDLVNDSVWRIYYASRDEHGLSRCSYIEVEAGNPEKILYIHKQPVLELGVAGSFDEHGIMPTCIVEIGGKKFLYYIGWSQRKSVPYQNSVGLAISSDNGKTFQKYSEGPVLGINAVDPFFVGTMFVLNDQSVYRGYYLSCVGWKEINGKQESSYILKYAESPNGIDWERKNEVAVPFKDASEGGLSSAAVLRTKDGYSMWFSRRGESDFRTNSAASYRIGFASSKDGKTWQRNDDRAGIDVSASGWDSEMIAYPYVVEHNGRYFMFYNGNGFGRSGLGYATMSID